MALDVIPRTPAGSSAIICDFGNLVGPAVEDVVAGAVVQRDKALDDPSSSMTATAWRRPWGLFPPACGRRNVPANAGEVVGDLFGDDVKAFGKVQVIEIGWPFWWSGRSSVKSGQNDRSIDSQGGILACETPGLPSVR